MAYVLRYVYVANPPEAGAIPGWRWVNVPIPPNGMTWADGWQVDQPVVFLPNTQAPPPPAPPENATWIAPVDQTAVRTKPPAPEDIVSLIDHPESPVYWIVTIASVEFENWDQQVWNVNRTVNQVFTCYSKADDSVICVVSPYQTNQVKSSLAWWSSAADFIWSNDPYGSSGHPKDMTAIRVCGDTRCTASGDLIQQLQPGDNGGYILICLTAAGQIKVIRQASPYGGTEDLYIGVSWNNPVMMRPLQGVAIAINSSPDSLKTTPEVLTLVDTAALSVSTLTLALLPYAATPSDAYTLNDNSIPVPGSAFSSFIPLLDQASDGSWSGVYDIYGDGSVYTRFHWSASGVYQYAEALAQAPDYSCTSLLPSRFYDAAPAPTLSPELEQITKPGQPVVYFPESSGSEQQMTDWAESALPPVPEIAPLPELEKDTSGNWVTVHPVNSDDLQWTGSAPVPPITLPAGTTLQDMVEQLEGDQILLQNSPTYYFTIPTGTTIGQLVDAVGGSVNVPQWVTWEVGNGFYNDSYTLQQILDAEGAGAVIHYASELPHSYPQGTPVSSIFPEVAPGQLQLLDPDALHDEPFEHNGQTHPAYTITERQLIDLISAVTTPFPPMLEENGTTWAQHPDTGLYYPLETWFGGSEDPTETVYTLGHQITISSTPACAPATPPPAASEYSWFGHGVVNFDGDLTVNAQVKFYPQLQFVPVCPVQFGQPITKHAWRVNSWLLDLAITDAAEKIVRLALQGGSSCINIQMTNTATSSAQSMQITGSFAFPPADEGSWLEGSNYTVIGLKGKSVTPVTVKYQVNK